MKLEQQVCSLDLAKRLTELGVKQESLWYWFKDRLILGYDEGFNMKALTPAYTVAELGEMLPNELTDDEDNESSWWMISGPASDTLWGCEYEKHPDIQAIYADAEADARAKMLIYLLENGLIKS